MKFRDALANEPGHRERLPRKCIRCMNARRRMIKTPGRRFLMEERQCQMGSPSVSGTLGN